MKNKIKCLIQKKCAFNNQVETEFDKTIYQQNLVNHSPVLTKLCCKNTA